MTKSKLETLNAFRAREGLKPLKDWREKRHQPMLEEYVAADNAERFDVFDETVNNPLDPANAVNTRNEVHTPLDDNMVAELVEAFNAVDRGEVATVELDSLAGVGKVQPIKRSGPVLKSIEPVKSTLAEPFVVARTFIRANIDKMSRKEIILALVAMGINKNTATTRYQRIKSGEDKE